LQQAGVQYDDQPPDNSILLTLTPLPQELVDAARQVDPELAEMIRYLGNSVSYLQQQQQSSLSGPQAWQAGVTGAPVSSLLKGAKQQVQLVTGWRGTLHSVLRWDETMAGGRRHLRGAILDTYQLPQLAPLVVSRDE
jgi:hypothetical protein